MEQASDSEDEEMTDTEGLQRAYAAGSKMYHHRKSNTLYVAGTSSIGDVMEWPDIPLHRVPETTRYRSVDRYLRGLGQDNLPKRIVGHSLGGSVALELSKNYNIEATTYGAPVVDPIPRNPCHKPDRFACRFDSVASLDFGAKKVECTDRANPHSYAGLENFRKHGGSFSTLFGNF
jgi:pimeloyl-ACP methyl ester carboxylesterase